MTEYEEITNDKNTEQLIHELEYQLNNQGYNISDSFPQHIIECIHKLNPNKRQTYIKFVEIDYWSRPLYKYINRDIYLGSLNHLLPDKQIAPNGTKEEINDFFRLNPEAFVYFGTEPDCDPNGGKFKEDVQFIILNIK